MPVTSQRWIKLTACTAFVALGVAAFFISRTQKDPAFVIDLLAPRDYVRQVLQFIGYGMR